MTNRTLPSLILFPVLGLFSSVLAQVPQAQAVVNAADYSNALSPGALISLFGDGFTTGTTQAATLPLPTTLRDVSVEISDGQRTIMAPLTLISPRQINAQLPYDLGSATIQLVVRNASGPSNAVSATLTPRSPRLFTFTSAGTGSAVATEPDGTVIQSVVPAKPGDVLQLYVNSLGAVDPAVAAGFPPGNGGDRGPINVVRAPVDVTVRDRPAEVFFAGLAPGFPGLYQINFRMPYDDLVGDVPIVARSGQSTSQSGVVIRTRANGFYSVSPGGKFPNGQTKNNLAGPNSAVAFAQVDAGQWGNEGLRSWSKSTGLDAINGPASGIALTLKNGQAIVYDNNGLEDNTFGSFYNNVGGGPDTLKPGLQTFYSNSNRFGLVTAGYFKLNVPTTFTQLIGYFEANGPRELPFDPANIYNRFRMNIWANKSPNDTPGFTENFAGDVFSSDAVEGQFAFSNTGVERVFQSGVRIPIFRVVLNLKSPFTLPPGEYWFSHDTAVPVASSSQKAITRAIGESSTAPYVTVRPSGRVVPMPE